MKTAVPLLERSVPATLLRWELAAVCLLAWALLVSIPVTAGELGLSWDAINHHVYLGWTAERHRLDLDFVAAGYQSYQAPYLNWPLYRMAVGGWSGVSAAIALATLEMMAVVPVWVVARACAPGASVFDLAMRALAVALALLSCVVLSSFGATVNDMLAAAPLLWAVALVLGVAGRLQDPGRVATMRRVLLSGLCAGIAVGLKLSNGPLAVLLPALWLLCGREWRGRVQAVLAGTAGALAGFAVSYGYWGWLLWRRFGNPLFPFYDHWFAPLRAWLGWAG